MEHNNVYCMKKVLFVLALLLNCFCGLAQKYIVYSVSGNISEMKAGSSIKILPKKRLNENSFLNISQLSRIVIINENDKVMYTISGKSEGTVRQLLKTGKSVAAKKLSPQYYAILLNKLSNTNTRNTYMQSAATSFRDGDKIIEKLDSLNNSNDSICNR